MKKAIMSLAAAAVMALGAGAASASTMTFDYTGGATNPGGPALSCSAFGIFNFAGCSVTYNAGGLGVNGAPDTNPGQIDGFPLFSSERLTFDFGHDVVWKEISFGYWDRNDDARLTWDGGTTTVGPGGPSTVGLGDVVSRYLTVTAYGQLFRDGFGNDDFTVASLTVAPVPLPAAGWMLLAGIGGIAAMKRRKKANA